MKYRMTCPGCYTEGYLDINIEVEAPSPEVAERLIKKHLSNLFRKFPSGMLIGIYNFQVGEVSMGGLNEQGAAQLIVVSNPMGYGTTNAIPSPALPTTYLIYDPATGQWNPPITTYPAGASGTVAIPSNGDNNGFITVSNQAGYTIQPNSNTYTLLPSG